MIPYGHQDISEADIQAVVDVLRSDFLTQGPAVPAFEKAVANYCSAKHAVAANSATSALHLACLALGVGKGDVVWTSPITFVASANCALYCGAEVDFVDIDPHTYNLSVACLSEKLARAKKNGRLPKVVIPVHLCGQPCDMAGIYALSQQYGFKIIEDASHAIGGKYKNEPIGNCRYSDITVFSFHPVKIITTGEGGLAVTNDVQLARKMQLLRSHGITRDPIEMSGESEGGWYYQQVELGYNYRMTDMQAALGSSQLQRLDAFISRRMELADYYSIALTSFPISVPQGSSDSAWHLYVIQVDEARAGISRKTIFDALRVQGIQANVHYMPVHLQPYYRNLGYTLGDFPAAEYYYERCLTLPLYPGLTDDEQNRIIKELGTLLRSR